MSFYLVVASREAAQARSREAYDLLRPAEEPEGAITDAVWSVVEHTGDGRAALVVAAVEGATAMCRAKRGAEPLDQVGRQLEAVIGGALDSAA